MLNTYVKYVFLQEIDDSLLKPLFGGKQRGDGGDDDGSHSFATSDAGDDLEGPSLRRPLFTDQHYFFGNPDGEEQQQQQLSQGYHAGSERNGAQGSEGRRGAPAVAAPLNATAPHSNNNNNNRRNINEEESSVPAEKSKATRSAGVIDFGDDD